MARPPSRTQHERRSGTEEALLTAAAELVAERGVERATMAGIGERAGTSRGLPNHRFGSKDELVARLAERAQDLLNSAVEEAVGSVDHSYDQTLGLELVLAVADTYLGRFERPTAHDRALLVMWGETFPSEAASAGMVQADRRALAGWSGMVEKGQRDGSVRPDLDPATCAVLLQGLVRGVSALLMTHPGEAPGPAVRSSVSTLVRDLLTADTC